MEWDWNRNTNILISKLINLHGSYGPTILFFYTIYLLRNRQFSLFYYIIGYIINIFMNFGLKGVLQQPRPGISEKQLKLLLENKKRFILKNGFPYDIFGMPSGHSQSSFYSTIFMTLVLKDNWQLIIYLFICVCVIYQRITDNHHTLLQVIAGSLTGLLIGYITFYISKESIKGKLTEKKDDEAVN
jgi:membrane-associated phospholipid phosphatase